MNPKKKFGMIGLALGAAYGIYAIVSTYAAEPGIPGGPEVLVQFVIVTILTAVSGSVGFVVGFVVNFFQKK